MGYGNRLSQQRGSPHGSDASLPSRACWNEQRRNQIFCEVGFHFSTPMVLVRYFLSFKSSTNLDFFFVKTNVDIMFKFNFKIRTTTLGSMLSHLLTGLCSLVSSCQGLRKMWKFGWDKLFLGQCFSGRIFSYKYLIDISSRRGSKFSKKSSQLA